MKTMRNITIFLLFTLFVGMSGIFASCNVIGTHGDGNVIKQERKVSSFDGIDVSGAFDIFLKQGPVEQVTVEADENLMSIIRTDVVGGTLRIDLKKPINHATTMKVYITVKELKDIDVSGAVDIKTEGRITGNDLSIDASGASDSQMEIAYQKLSLDCSGASKLVFSGMANAVTADLSGACDIYAFEMPAESYSLSLSGAGKADIHVTKSLRVEISGAGSVKYKGSPTEIDQDISGAGSIKKVN
jgi:hypothetical protein